MKPTLLVVTPRLPYPVVGGDRLRIYHQCQVLSQHFNLTLLSLCATRQELNAELPADGIFQRVERHLHPRWKSWFNTLLALPGNLPLQIAYFRSGKLRQRIRHLAPQHDAVLAHLIRAGDMTQDLHGFNFLEMTDAISLGYQRLTQSQPTPRGFMPWVYSVESRRLKSYEQRIVQRFTHTFLISEIDRQFLFGHDPQAASRTSIVTNGVDLVKLPYQFSPAGGHLVFIGNMSTVPNLDAVHHFATDILPLIAQLHPQVRLRVIGRIGPGERQRLQQFKGVDVVGEVDNIAQAAMGGGVGVCPMRLGAGVQNKLLEYMALGLPAVSTTIGQQGIHATPGTHLMVADTPHQFANAVSHLLTNRSAASALAQAARSYVEQHHTWQQVLTPMAHTMLAQLPQSAPTPVNP